MLINDNISSENLDQIMQDLNDKSIPVNNCVDNIEKLFFDAANATFGPEYTVEINSKKPRKPKFSNETLVKKNAYKLAKKENKGKNRGDAAMNNVVNTSRNYKYAVRGEKAKEIRSRNKRFRSNKTKDRKYFWSMLSNKKKSPKAMPNLNSFFNSFQDIAAGEEHGEYVGNDDNEDENIIIDEELQLTLDSKFTLSEIDNMVKILKNKKACGRDKILNEYICTTYNKLRPMYTVLFNRVLEDGIVPESWLNGMIMPIYKSKGSSDDPDNYRGITNV